MNRYKFFILSLTLICVASLSAKDYYATDYYATDFGVIADGKTLNTNSIQKGIDFVNKLGGGRLVFTAGNYLTGSIYLKSNVTLHLEEGATLLGSTNPLGLRKRFVYSLDVYDFRSQAAEYRYNGEGDN